jgi:Sulfotransferase family
MEYRPRVLLVTGFGRSGTTLVNTILGSTPQVFAGGEIRFLWERGLLERRQCGCGQPVDVCPVWLPVLEKAFGKHTEIDAKALVAEDGRVMRTRYLPWMLASRTSGERLLRRLDALPDALTAVYRSIQEVTGARLIVDSSKPPSFGHVLQHLEAIDLRILHVVRDPRAVAHSWTRAKPLTDGGPRREMLRLSPWESALQWDLWNSAVEWLWRRSDRYLRLRYEDLVAEPESALRRVLEFAGVGDLAPPFTAPRVLEAATVHTVAGNADRMRSGPVELRADDAWERELPPRSRRLVTALTLPLASHYGYRASLDHRRSSR